MRSMKKICLITMLAAGLLLSACLPAVQSTPLAPTSAPAELTPFYTSTPTAQETQPASSPTGTPLPAPTPTPRSHTLTNSDTLLSLAWYYGVSLEAILEANPGINPNALSVGKTILIPAAPQNSTQTAPTATPVPLDTGAINCAPVRDGGVWCFWPVTNGTSQPVENVSAQILLADAGAETVLSQPAFSPLNRILPGQTLVLSAYFPAPVPQPFQVSASIKTVLPVNAGDTRYLPIQVENARTAIDSGSLSAVVSADLQLTGERAARKIWVVLTAYDSEGKVAGLRRWESSQEAPAGASLPVEISVYSTGAAIARVEIAAEAQP